ncbi:MAG: endolytic transglycosylase MltG [Gemmatimonadales bacterium]
MIGLSALLVACASPGPDTPKAHVYIPRGASLAAVAESLETHGVIETAWTFRAYARVRGLAKRVRPGLYAFPLGERFSVIVGALATGRTDDALFTVPEGRTVRDIADLAADALRLAHDSAKSAVRDSFLAAARDPALRAELGINVPPGVKEPLEGYLLPETYRVAFDDTPRDLVKHMLRQFLSVWDSAADRKAAALGLSRHQVVTLASIVEGEAEFDPERRTIAGVYYNRIKKRMKLGADPTVIYAVRLVDPRPIHRVLLRHLQVRSPYNTYMHPGLPPGPINNPGRLSILAALDPQAHDLYYFVARPDGHHMFSHNAREHGDSVRVARILRARVDAAREAMRRDSIRAAAAQRDSIRRAARRHA